MIFSKFMSGKTFELKTFLLGFFILTLSKLLIFMTLINTKVTKSQYLTMYSSNWFGDRLHSILIFSEFKGATKLYFMHCSYEVIILFNTGLYKSGFATDFFGKLFFVFLRLCFLPVTCRIFVNFITFV